MVCIEIDEETKERLESIAKLLLVNKEELVDTAIELLFYFFQLRLEVPKEIQEVDPEFYEKLDEYIGKIKELLETGSIIYYCAR